MKSDGPTFNHPVWSFLDEPEIVPAIQESVQQQISRLIRIIGVLAIACIAFEGMNVVSKKLQAKREHMPRQTIILPGFPDRSPRAADPPGLSSPDGGTSP